jgi:GT2 family glycosyltransferase
MVMIASLIYPFAPRFSSEGTAGLVSVVLVHYRGTQDLRDCVASLAVQDWPEIELILVDNDSAEGLPPVGDLLALRPQPGLSLRTVQLERNEGFAGGANAGAAAARGEYIFFLNPDTTLQPSCITALVAAGADIATARLLLADDPSLLDNCGHALFPDGLNWCRGRGQSAAGRFLESEDVLLFSGAAVLFRRSALARTGGFDPAYFAYGEDADLSLRAARLGLRCRYVADACVHHKVGGSIGRLALRKVLWVERNRSRVAITHLPWTWLLASPWWTLRRHLALGKGAAAGRGLAASWPTWQRPLLPIAVLAAHVASLWDVPGNLRRRRALGGGMDAELLRPARVGVAEILGRPTARLDIKSKSA